MRILVTGASRGLGLEFTRQLAARGDHVFASCRRPDQAETLKALKAQRPDHITIVPLDVADVSSIRSAYEMIKGQAEALDMLINNAGVFRKEDPLGGLDQQTMLHLLTVNAVGPILVTQQFLDLLKAGQPSKIINITSGLGSLAWRDEGGKYSYAASKAALNMLNRTLAFDLKNTGITTIVIDPGWVKTDMGGPNAWITPEESVQGILKVIDGLTPADSGKFFHYSGSELPW